MVKSIAENKIKMPSFFLHGLVLRYLDPDLYPRYDYILLVNSRSMQMELSYVNSMAAPFFI